MTTIFAIYCLIGGVAGVLAGLLGIGGGLVIVPMLMWALAYQGFAPEIIMHMALGTSMASIMFTSISSFMAHHRRGAVRWDVVRSISPGILIGTFLGSCFAALLPTNFLKGFFCIFLFVVATQMLIDKKPKASKQLPGMLGLFSMGNLIGALSSLVGIGGGTMSVPFMVWCNIPLHQAIGTSAAIGLPIAVSGTVGYIYNGWHVVSQQHLALGYVNLFALVGIACVSIFTAPFGARLAHKLPVATLKKVFACLLYVVAIKMLYGLW